MTVIAQARLELNDPHDCTDSSDELTIYHALYDTLVRRVEQDYLPHLAESWTVSDDARTWDFVLRKDVAFHDGTLCDAQAVADNLVRMAREDKGYTLGAPAVWKQYLGTAQLSVSSPHALSITLGEPMADLLDVLEQGFIVAPSAFTALDAGDHNTQIGSGPYRLTDVAPDSISAARVDGHFSGKPENRTITWRHVPEAGKRLALLAAGQVQAASELDFEASCSIGGMRHEFLSPVAIIYLLNAAKGPLKDPRLRLALSLAVARQALIAEVVGDGAAQPLSGFVSPHHYGAATTHDTICDRPEARRLIAAAGYPDGLRLTVDCPTRLPDEAERLTAALARQLSEIGVTFDVRIHREREDYAHMVRRKEIGDLCVFDSSPMSTYRVLYEKIDSRIAGSWWQGYENPQVEALIDKGRSTTNRTERAGIWQQAYHLLQNDPAWLTLYNPVRVIGLAGEHPDFQMPADGVIDVARLPALDGANT